MGLARRLSALGLVLSALLVRTWSHNQRSVFAIVGENFTFSPEVNGTIREITWMKMKNKVAEWENGTESPTYFSSLLERGALDTSSGSLTIRELNTGDTAAYEAQVLPLHDDQLQYTNFVLEVLAPPLPSALNCSVSNRQIRISCEIRFPKAVRYSWYQDGKKIADANSFLVLQLKENEDPSKKVMCIREVSKTKINETISLSACFPVSPKSLSRGRNGLIAFFVLLLLLLLCMGLLFFLRGRGLLPNICRLIPTKNSAVYKIKEENLPGEDRYPEANVQNKDEAATSLQCANESQAEKDYENVSEGKREPDVEENRILLDSTIPTSVEAQEKDSKDAESMNQSVNKENPDYENVSEEKQEPDVEENRNLLDSPIPTSGKERKDLATNSMNPPDLLPSQEKTEHREAE